jgi:hypothetical protein
LEDQAFIKRLISFKSFLEKTPANIRDDMESCSAKNITARCARDAERSMHNQLRRVKEHLIIERSFGLSGSVHCDVFI